MSKSNRNLLFDWFSIFNIYWAFNGRWKIWTTNLDIIKRHVNRDLIDSKLIKEARKTAKPLEDHSDPSLYKSCIQYYAGDYGDNIRLNNREELGERDAAKINHMKKSIQTVLPLPFCVDLIHGFEPDLFYNTHEWDIGELCYFPFFVSKTLSWKVATLFATAAGNRFYQEYLLCRYTKPGSRHICLDIKQDKDDEYEFLSGFETFKYVEKIYHFSLIPWPILRIYYVMEHVKTDDSIEIK